MSVETLMKKSIAFKQVAYKPFGVAAKLPSEGLCHFVTRHYKDKKLVVQTGNFWVHGKEIYHNIETDITSCGGILIDPLTKRSFAMHYRKAGDGKSNVAVPFPGINLNVVSHPNRVGQHSS
jgi:hypothetical protein